MKIYLNIVCIEELVDDESELEYDIFGAYEGCNCVDCQDKREK